MDGAFRDDARLYLTPLAWVEMLIGALSSTRSQVTVGSVLRLPISLKSCISTGRA